MKREGKECIIAIVFMILYTLIALGLAFLLLWLSNSQVLFLIKIAGYFGLGICWMFLAIGTFALFGAIIKYGLGDE